MSTWRRSVKKTKFRSLHECKGYNARQFITEFPDKGWTKRHINKFLVQLRKFGTVDRRPGSGRPRSARTDENVDAVESLVLSQEDKPQSHRTVREISREARIHRSSVSRIIHKDLRLKCCKKRRAQELTDANCKARLLRSLLLLDKFSDTDSDFIFFTDEKVFHVASPVNMQNDRVYVPHNVRKREIAAERLLRCRPTFSKSLMVSVAISKLGCSELFFVEPGGKVDGRY